MPLSQVLVYDTDSEGKCQDRMMPMEEWENAQFWVSETNSSALREIEAEGCLDASLQELITNNLHKQRELNKHMKAVRDSSESDSGSDGEVQKPRVFDSHVQNDAYLEHMSPSEWSRDQARKAKKADPMKKLLGSKKVETEVRGIIGQKPVTYAQLKLEATRRVMEWKTTDEAVWTQAELNLWSLHYTGLNRVAQYRKMMRNNTSLDVDTRRKQAKIKRQEMQEEKLGLQLREVVAEDIRALTRYVAHNVSQCLHDTNIT